MDHFSCPMFFKPSTCNCQIPGTVMLIFAHISLPGSKILPVLHHDDPQQCKNTCNGPCAMHAKGCTAKSESRFWSSK